MAAGGKAAADLEAYSYAEVTRIIKQLVARHSGREPTIDMVLAEAAPGVSRKAGELFADYVERDLRDLIKTQLDARVGVAPVESGDVEMGAGLVEESAVPTDFTNLFSYQPPTTKRKQTALEHDLAEFLLRKVTQLFEANPNPASAISPDELRLKIWDAVHVWTQANVHEKVSAAGGALDASIGAAVERYGQLMAAKQAEIAAAEQAARAAAEAAAAAQAEEERQHAAEEAAARLAEEAERVARLTEAERAAEAVLAARERQIRELEALQARRTEKINEITAALKGIWRPQIDLLQGFLAKTDDESKEAAIQGEIRHINSALEDAAYIACALDEKKPTLDMLNHGVPALIASSLFCDRFLVPCRPMVGTEVGGDALSEPRVMRWLKQAVFPAAAGVDAVALPIAEDELGLESPQRAYQDKMTALYREVGNLRNSLVRYFAAHLLALEGALPRGAETSEEIMRRVNAYLHVYASDNLCLRSEELQRDAQLQYMTGVTWLCATQPTSDDQPWCSMRGAYSGAFEAWIHRIVGMYNNESDYDWTFSTEEARQYQLRVTLLQRLATPDLPITLKDFKSIRDFKLRSEGSEIAELFCKPPNQSHAYYAVACHLLRKSLANETKPILKVSAEKDLTPLENRLGQDFALRLRRALDQLEDFPRYGIGGIAYAAIQSAASTVEKAEGESEALWRAKQLFIAAPIIAELVCDAFSRIVEQQVERKVQEKVRQLNQEGSLSDDIDVEARTSPEIIAVRKQLENEVETLRLALSFRFSPMDGLTSKAQIRRAERAWVWHLNNGYLARAVLDLFNKAMVGAGVELDVTHATSALKFAAEHIESFVWCEHAALKTQLLAEIQELRDAVQATACVGETFTEHLKEEDVPCSSVFFDPEHDGRLFLDRMHFDNQDQYLAKVCSDEELEDRTSPGGLPYRGSDRVQSRERLREIFFSTNNPARGFNLGERGHNEYKSIRIAALFSNAEQHKRMEDFYARQLQAHAQIFGEFVLFSIGDKQVRLANAMARRKDDKAAYGSAVSCRRWTSPSAWWLHMRARLLAGSQIVVAGLFFIILWSTYESGFKGKHSELPSLVMFQNLTILLVALMSTVTFWLLKYAAMATQTHQMTVEISTMLFKGGIAPRLTNRMWSLACHQQGPVFSHFTKPVAIAAGITVGLLIAFFVGSVLNVNASGSLEVFGYLLAVASYMGMGASTATAINQAIFAYLTFPHHLSPSSDQYPAPAGDHDEEGGFSAPLLQDSAVGSVVDRKASSHQLLAQRIRTQSGLLAVGSPQRRISMAARDVMRELNNAASTDVHKFGAMQFFCNTYGVKDHPGWCRTQWFCEGMEMPGEMPGIPAEFPQIDEGAEPFEVMVRAYLFGVYSYTQMDNMLEADERFFAGREQAAIIDEADAVGAVGVELVRVDPIASFRSKLIAKQIVQWCEHFLAADEGLLAAVPLPLLVSVATDFWVLDRCIDYCRRSYRGEAEWVAALACDTIAIPPVEGLIVPPRSSLHGYFEPRHATTMSLLKQALLAAEFRPHLAARAVHIQRLVDAVLTGIRAQDDFGMMLSRYKHFTSSRDHNLFNTLNADEFNITDAAVLLIRTQAYLMHGDDAVIPGELLLLLFNGPLPAKVKPTFAVELSHYLRQVGHLSDHLIAAEQLPYQDYHWYQLVLPLFREKIKQWWHDQLLDDEGAASNNQEVQQLLDHMQAIAQQMTDDNDAFGEYAVQWVERIVAYMKGHDCRVLDNILRCQAGSLSEVSDEERLAALLPWFAVAVHEALAVANLVVPDLAGKAVKFQQIEWVLSHQSLPFAAANKRSLREIVKPVMTWHGNNGGFALAAFDYLNMVFVEQPFMPEAIGVVLSQIHHLPTYWSSDPEATQWAERFIVPVLRRYASAIVHPQKTWVVHYRSNEPLDDSYSMVSDTDRHLLWILYQVVKDDVCDGFNHMDNVFEFFKGRQALVTAFRLNVIGLHPDHVARMTREFVDEHEREDGVDFTGPEPPPILHRRSGAGEDAAAAEEGFRLALPPTANAFAEILKRQHFQRGVGVTCADACAYYFWYRLLMTTAIAIVGFLAFMLVASTYVDVMPDNLVWLANFLSNPVALRAFEWVQNLFIGLAFVTVTISFAALYGRDRAQGEHERALAIALAMQRGEIPRHIAPTNACCRPSSADDCCASTRYFCTTPAWRFLCQAPERDQYLSCHAQWSFLVTIALAAFTFGMAILDESLPDCGIKDAVWDQVCGALPYAGFVLGFLAVGGFAGRSFSQFVWACCTTPRTVGSNRFHTRDGVLPFRTGELKINSRPFAADERGTPQRRSCCLGNV